MSMNILIEAFREVQVVKTGKISTQRTYWEAWQTPTNVTYGILESVDPTQAYRDWVKSSREPYTSDIYADDDDWCERDPIGTEVIDEAAIHIKDFDDWLQMCEAEGYTVKYNMI